MRGLRMPIVIGLLYAVLWGTGFAATAQPTNKPKYPPVTPSVLPSVLTPPPSPSTPPENVTTPPSVAPSRQPREPLPFTGADLTLYALIGVALAGAGFVLVRVARRARSDS